MKKLILFTTVLAFVTSQAYGEGVSSFTPQSGDTTKSATTPASTAANNKVGATPEGQGTTRSSSGGNGTSINPGAKEGQKSQGSGIGPNLASGAMLIASAVPMMSNPPTQPMGAAMIAMALLALAQGLHDSQAAGDSAKTGMASNYDVGSYGATSYAANDPANPEFQKGVSNFVAAETKKANDALKGSGYSIDKDGLHSPNGSVTPKSAFSSPAAMASAGIDPAAIKEAQSILAKAEEGGPQFKISGMGLAEGGGGGGGGASRNHGSDENAYKNPFQLTNDAKKQIVAGKTVMFDGEPIGVRGQNIFDMVHTCYQKKRTRNDFIEQDGVGARMRAPASVTPKRR